MRSRPLKILVCSEDRSLLRGLSRFLGAFGHEVQQAAERELAALALDWGAPDVLIVDSEPSMPSALELCRSACERGGRRHAYVFLLVEEPESEGLIDALEAGADDFLARPIIYGELLVRLRAAVRTLEFERRVREQSRVEPVSGLLSRSAFHEDLARTLSATTSQERSGSCVAVDLDFFEQINEVYGRAAADAVVLAAAGKLSSLCGETDSLACFGGGRFALWLPGRLEDEATEWAERARVEIEETTVEVAETTLRVTASFGVAEWAEAVGSAESLVQHALEAVDSAKTSGRQCVVRFSEFDTDAEAWEELATTGKLFKHTVARDVMTPWPLVLEAEQAAGQTAALLRQTGLRALPVVDAGGSFAGLVFDQSVRGELSANVRLAGPVSAVMTTEVPTCDEDSDFSELIRLLEGASGSLVVILGNGWPTGFVALKNLAAMSEPLDTSSFTPKGPYSNTSDYLLVHDPSSLDLA